GQLASAPTLVGHALAALDYLTGLALPNTAPYRLSGDLVRDVDEWRVTNLAGTVGESDLRGRLTVDASGERPYLTGDIASRKLNFDDLGPLIGARPKGEKAAAPAKAVAANDAGRVLPDTPLHVERLREMNAAV